METTDTTSSGENLGLDHEKDTQPRSYLDSPFARHSSPTLPSYSPNGPYGNDSSSEDSYPYITPPQPVISAQKIDT